MITLATTLLLSVTALTASTPSLVEDGTPQQGYRSLAKVDSESLRFYTQEQLQYSSYYLVPQVSELRTWVSPDSTTIRFQMGNFYSIDGDLSKITSRGGKVVEEFRGLAPLLKVRVSQTLRNLIDELNNNSITGRFQAEDLRDGGTRLYEVKFSKIKYEKLEDSLSGMLAASLKYRTPMSIWLVIDTKNAIDSQRIIGTDPFVVEIADGAGTRETESVAVNLPAQDDWDRWGANGKSEVFYKAYERLDTILIPYLERMGLPDSLTSIPDLVWKKQLLEEAMKVYYEDPSKSAANACDGYYVRPLGLPVTGLAKIVYFKFKPSPISIPLRVVSTKAL